MHSNLLWLIRVYFMEDILDPSPYEQLKHSANGNIVLYDQQDIQHKNKLPYLERVFLKNKSNSSTQCLQKGKTINYFLDINHVEAEVLEIYQLFNMYIFEVKYSRWESIYYNMDGEYEEVFGSSYTILKVTKKSLP